MSKKNRKQKTKKPKPRIFHGFRDVFSEDLLIKQKMIHTIREIYEQYGFIPLETPALEFVDNLGKFLPEATTPQGGIFSFRNPDLIDPKADNPNLWLALRYDLTAPLARVVAQYKDLQKPFRRYQLGVVWRHEKPGPGRFREFYQFDFDSVGTSSMAVDAETCSIMCDTLEALGFETGRYLVRVNHRKVLQGILEVCQLSDLDITAENSQAGAVLRSIDKLDRLGMDGVVQLLGKGRKDSSGAFTEGAQLENSQIETIEKFLQIRPDEGENGRKNFCDQLEELVQDSPIGREGIDELRQIDEFLSALGYSQNRVQFDPTVIRGMSYYTGPVFEGVLTDEITDDKGQKREFGSVFGGGRYDDLIQRFTGQKVPATGASIGLDRLFAALKMMKKASSRPSTAEVLVTVMDKKRMVDYLKIAREIRQQGIPTEVFFGSGNIGKQLKYADKMAIPLVVIAGSEEFEKGEFQIKDLQLGIEMSKEMTDREQWCQERPAQQAVPKEKLIEKLRELLQGRVPS